MMNIIIYDRVNHTASSSLNPTSLRIAWELGIKFGGVTRTYDFETSSPRGWDIDGPPSLGEVIRLERWKTHTALDDSWSPCQVLQRMMHRNM